MLANFYLPKLHQNAELPRILGLSASPVMRAKASTVALQEIERNMNAITKTPKVHRSELLRFVHRPQLVRIDFPPTQFRRSVLFTALELVVQNYDISKDPYVMDLVSNSDRYHNFTKKLEEACCKNNTYCLRELQTLVSKYKATAEELGSSVADWCLRQCIAQFQKQVS